MVNFGSKVELILIAIHAYRRKGYACTSFYQNNRLVNQYIKILESFVVVVFEWEFFVVGVFVLPFWRAVMDLQKS